MRPERPAKKENFWKEDPSQIITSHNRVLEKTNEYKQAHFDTDAGVKSYFCYKLLQSAIFVMMFSGRIG